MYYDILNKRQEAINKVKELIKQGYKYSEIKNDFDISYRAFMSLKSQCKNK